ncbi:MAG: hypothetical protein AAF212_10770, partial [Verrucomicrobiota bacterium]
MKSILILNTLISLLLVNGLAVGETISLQIKLSGGKSHVVSLKQRAQAIEFLEEILSPEYNAEEPAFEDLKDPF